MDCSTPGFPVLHYLLEFAQTHVHWVGDAIQPSHPLLSPSPPIINLSPYQGLFKWVSFTSGGQSIGASASASVLPMNIQGRFPFGLTGLEIKYPCGPRNSQEFSPAPQFKSINSSVLSLFYHPALIPLLHSGDLNLKWSPLIFKEYLQFWDSRICDTNLCFLQWLPFFL